MKRSFLVLLLGLALPFALRADAPNVYAIRGARLVTAAGAPIESGTLVIRGGLIEAVAANAAPKPTSPERSASDAFELNGSLILSRWISSNGASEPPKGLLCAAPDV